MHHLPTNSSSSSRGAAKRAVIGTVAGAAVLAGAGVVASAQTAHAVSLSVDGKATEVQTHGDTVREVLADQGIKTGQRDVVAPSLDTPVDDGDSIAVRYAKPVTLDVDGEESTHYVLATDVSQALGEIGERYQQAELSTSRSAEIGRQGIELSITTPKSVKVKVGSAKMKKVSKPVSTAGELLDAMGADHNKDDYVQVTPKGEKKPTPGFGQQIEDGDKVVLVRKYVFEKKVREHLAPRTVTRYSDSMAQGKSRVAKSGSDGIRRATYKVTRVNGERVKKRLVKATALRDSSPRVVVIGTREPKPAPAPTPAPAANYASGGTVWDQIAQCESGGNWAANTGNGYYGGLQFSLSTWQSYGGTGLPSENSREQQIAIAEKVRNAEGGYGAWPVCGSGF